MVTAIRDDPMADDKTKTQPVRLAMDVVESARIVSAYRNEPMAEMLSGILRPILAKMERDETTKRSRGGKKDR